MTSTPSPTFLHSGKLGDLIYALPTIRALGGGRLFVRADSALGFSEAAVNSVLPLLRVQSYIETAELWHGEKADHDLDAFRAIGGTHDNIAAAHLSLFGLGSGHADEPWLECNRLHPSKSHSVLFARSRARKVVDEFWKTCYETFHAEAAFVGTVQEHLAFEREIGTLPHLPTSDLLELAGLIVGADLFIGNQSCPYSIAEGLKQAAILEVDSECPNCIFRRARVLHVRSANDLWLIQHSRDLLGIVDQYRASWLMPEASPLDAIVESAAQELHGLEDLQLRLKARLPVRIWAMNPGHWTEVLSRVHGISDSNHEVADPPARLKCSPEFLTSVLLESGYRILSSVGTREACPDLTRPLARSIVATEEEGNSVEARLELRQVEFEAEAIIPVTDSQTVGQLGPAQIEGTSVIVLTYQSGASIESCLRSVQESLRSADELIVVDNASTDETVSKVEGCLAGKHQLLVNDRNLGFSAGVNVGLRASRGRLLVVLNPDTVVPLGWLKRLERRFADPLLGAVGPVSNYVSGWQFIGHHIAAEKPGLLSDDELRAELDRTMEGQSLITKLLIGFCFVVRRSTLDKVGLFDEDLFLGSDDLELSWRLRTHGYRLAIARDVFVRHSGGISFASLDDAIKQELLSQSSQALAAKIRAAYSPGPPPTSWQLFGNPIFSHMLG